MNYVVEKRNNAVQTENATIQDNRMEIVISSGGLISNTSEPKSSVTELFPWILEFRKMYKCIYAEKSMASLMNLMQYYMRNVSVSVKECYKRPLRAAKLKDSISEALLLFLYIYRELPGNCEKLTYLSLMSDLLAIYIDIELQVSEKCKDDDDKICAKLTSCLYVYLEHSTEHLLDTLIKVQFMCHSYHHILNPLITKVMKNVPMHPESSTMYIRYFFIYCLWRKINDNAAVKKQITATAIASLGPPPSTFSSSVLNDILPKVPKSEMISLKSLLHYKFDIRKHCEMFIQHCREANGNSFQQEKIASTADSSSRVNSEMPEDVVKKNVKYLDNNVNSIALDHTKNNKSVPLLSTLKSLNLNEKNSFKCSNTFVNNISMKHNSSKAIKTSASTLRRKFKKSNKIVLVDLTSDIALEKCIKIRKSRNLPWLKEAKKTANLKIIKGTRKIKKVKNKEDANNMCQSSPGHHHEEDSLLRDEAKKKIEYNAFQTAFTENNEDKVESVDMPVTCVDDIRTSINVNSDTKTADIQASTINSETILNETQSLSKEVLNIPDATINDSCSHNRNISNLNGNEVLNNGINGKTLTMQLIKVDIMPDLKTNEVESFKNICDVKTECPSVHSITISNDDDSEENVFYDTSNAIITNNDKIEKQMQSEININVEHNDEDNSGNKMSSSSSFNKRDCKSTCDSTAITKSNCKQVEVVESIDKDQTIVTEIGQCIESSSLKDDYNVKQKQSSPKHFKNSIAQTDKAKLKTDDYKEVNESIEYSETMVSDVRKSIWESSSSDKNTSHVLPRIENMENNENWCISVNLTHPNSNITNEKFDDVSLEVIKNKVSSDSHNVINDENKFINGSSELEENVDGLSLLASVSQHVSHLNPESGGQCDLMKVKDYASLKYTCYNQITDDETDTNDSSYTVSKLLENPSTEIINRIVGVYPEGSLDKFAFHVQLTPDNVDTKKQKSQTETGLDYNGESITNNLVATECNVQTTKENTNVILNGETVVLLQKSPNSNLYIINKAVKNSRDNHNDDEIYKLKEKNWSSTTDECGQYEVPATLNHVAYNLELPSYGKELNYSECKLPMGINKEIKVEPEDVNFVDAKPYTKVALSTDLHPVNTPIYQDINVISKMIEMRKSPKSSISYRQNIKKEFNDISSHVATNCTIPGYNGIHTRSHEVEAKHSLHIPSSHQTTLPSIYGNCPGNRELCVPYHKHCTSVSCSLQINTSTPLHSRTKSGSPCERSHCTCLNCTYDIVTHCRQCIHQPADSRVPCIETSPYFLSTHSAVQNQTQGHDKPEMVIDQLYNDQLLCEIEKSYLHNNSLEKFDIQCRGKEKVYNKDTENKLPLKKRLKAHAVAAFDEMPIVTDKIVSYPAMPMMSIAALEALDNTPQKRLEQNVKVQYDLSLVKKDNINDNFHYSSNLIRRDYYKDVHVSNANQNVTKENVRTIDRQYRLTNEQSVNTMCQDACLQRTVKTPAQRKEMITPTIASLNRFETEPVEQEGPCKKVKRTQSPPRQTRSSKRNVPKVNYSYTDVDPEWNPSGEPKRKRRKTSR